MRRSAGSLIALCWTALLLVGIPTGLIHLTGWPLPAHLPTSGELAGWVRQPLTPTTVVSTAVAVAWTMWAVLLAVAVRQLQAHAARLCRRLPRVHPPGPLQGLSAAMLGTVAVSTAATPTAAHPPTTATNVTHAASPVPGQPAAALPTDGQAHGRTPNLRADAQTGADARSDTVTVRPGDTLSGIAADRLTDANRWPEIFALNRGVRFGDVGGTLTDPNLIYPGWKLQLPDNATPPPTVPPATPAPAPARGQSDSGQPVRPGASTPPALPPETAAASPASGPSSSPADDDGVVAPHSPDGSASPRSWTPTPCGPTSTAPAAPRPAHASPGVGLPSGRWLDMGLVGAVLAAVALVWTHRRRRPRPSRTPLRLAAPDRASTPPVLDQLRRRLHLPSPTPDAGVDPDGVGAADADVSTDDHSRATHNLETNVTDDDTTEPAATPTSGPMVPTVNNPLAAVWSTAGPGADAAARGILVAALTTDGLDDRDARTWVVIPSATAAALLGTAGVALPDTPRLTVTAGLAEALDILETQALHRARLADRHDVDTVAALREADQLPEPLPPILLITDTPSRQQRARIAALLAQGQRLDIHAVLLGAWPDGNTVAADGTTKPAESDRVRHGHHPADVGRLAVLTPADTADLLVTLAESHTGQPQAGAPVDSATPTRPPSSAPPTATGRPATAHASTPLSEPADREHGPHQPVDGPGDENAPADAGTQQAPAGDRPVPPGPATRPVHPAAWRDASSDAEITPDADADRGPAGADATGQAPDGSGPQRPGRVGVTVLGAPTILGADPQRPLRKKSLELLVYLAVHDGIAATESILDDLLPDAPASKAPGRLYTYVSDLRTVLRHTGGPGSYLTHPDHRYVLNPQTIDVDLWRMRDAIRDAQQSTDPAARIAALRHAVDTYRGHLAASYDYEWIEPYREAVRQQALDAYLALADALAGSPAEQVTVLDTAIRHNSYAEELYRHAMRARAELGHLDAIRALRRTLTRALAEIDAEPGDDTIALADQLVAQLQSLGRRSGLRPAPHPGDGAAA